MDQYVLLSPLTICVLCFSVHILPDKPMSRKPTEVVAENCKSTLNALKLKESILLIYPFGNNLLSHCKFRWWMFENKYNVVLFSSWFHQSLPQSPRGAHQEIYTAPDWESGDWMDINSPGKNNQKIKLIKFALGIKITKMILVIRWNYYLNQN